MSNDKNDSPAGGGYYGGGYYYGEGYGGYGSEGGGGGERGIRDYLLMLRERIWLLAVVAFVVFLAVAIYTFNATKVYRAAAKVEVFRQQDRSVEFNRIVDMRIQSEEDFQTQIEIIESMAIIDRVVKRLKDDEIKRLMAPYEDQVLAGLMGLGNAAQVINNNRGVQPVRMSLMVVITFDHPDQALARDICNYIAKEYIQYNVSQSIDRSMEAVEELEQRANAQRQKVEELEMQLAEFKEKQASISFDENTNIDQQEIISLNTILTEDKRVLDEAETRWELIQKTRENDRKLWELSFIAQSPQVPDLLSRLSEQKIQVASLSKRYRHMHPTMIAAQQALEQTQNELTNAVNSAAETVYNNYQQALQNYENSKNRLDRKREQIIQLQKVRVDYSSIRRNYEVASEMYNYLYSRMQQAMTEAADNAETARIVDPAMVSPYPVSPNIPVYLAVGLFGGFGLGLALVFGLALLDDKVKSAHDIEHTVGLPLVGIVPRISKLDPTKKALAVINGADKHTTEAFRVIHSTLKLNEESRKAKVILTTSTVPSEGKSFVSTNLALTFAQHGEKTIIVDGDLRMPNVGKSLGLENNSGLLQILDGSKGLDDVLIRDFHDNADILVTGGRTKNPTQLLGGERFENLLHELRLRYDRIIIDSPPLAPVSDAMTILPLADGVLYVIRFNLVKRKLAQLNVKRLRESNVPIFGAILNNINASVAGYYYSHYYDASYRKYYLNDDNFDDEEQAGESKEKPATERV